jgi:hypothetical protein
VLFIAIGAMCAAFFVATLGPSRLDRARADAVQEQREAREWNVRSRELWERFDALYGFYKRDWRKLTPEDRNLLKEALDLRERYVVHSLGDPEMLIDLIRERWAEIHAEECRSKSMEIEKEAEKARDAGDYAAAARLFEESLAWEKKIQQEYAASKKRDQVFSRITRLTDEVRRANGTPVWQESRKTEAEGKALAAEGEALAKSGDFEAAEKKWAEAVLKYNRVLETDEILTTKYNSIFPSQYLRGSGLRVTRDTLATRADHERLQRRMDEADKLGAAGRYAEAGKLWDEIRVRYDAMRRSHHRSAHVRESEEIARETRRDLLLSRQYYDILLQRIAEMDAGLRAGRVGGVSNEALLILGEERRIHEKFPRSNPLALPINEKLRYLVDRNSEIALVQQQLKGMLRPVPGHPGLLLLSTEMPQSIYSFLLGSSSLNPSAVRGDLLPVDSAAYQEAEECCRRLGWMLGTTVRLPKEAELRAALGTPDPARLAGQAWSFENSNAAPHPIGSKAANEHGFHDLLGNVSEWTLSAAHADDAMEFGGNYQDSLASLASIPVERRPKRDKSRLRGFRVLVEPVPALPEGKGAASKP